MYIQTRFLIPALLGALLVIPGCQAAGLLIPLIEKAIDEALKDDQDGDLIPDGTEIGDATDLEVALGGRFCCDPASGTDQRVTTVTIRHTGDSKSDRILWEFVPETETKLYAASISGALSPGESIDIDIFAQDCDFYRQDFRMRTYFEGDFGIPGRSATTTITVRNVCDLDEPVVDSFGKLLTGVSIQAQLAPTFTLVEFGEAVRHGDKDVPDKIPSVALSQISYYGALDASLDANELEQLFTGATPVFPLGANSNGTVFQADLTTAMPEGDYRLVYFAVDGEFDLIDESRIWRFGVMFDSDGDSANDLTPDAQTINDPRQGTDSWYFLDFAPGDSWNLRRIASDGSELASGARVIQRGNVLVWVIPKSEVPGPSASYRVMTFTHKGDGGLGSSHNWSGDHHPVPPATASLQD